MDLIATEGSEARFTAYIDGLSSVIGHSGRVGPLQDYARGLLLPVARKSVEPLAAVTAPLRASAQHQSLLHFIGNAAWSDEKLLAKVQELTLPVLQRQESVQAWIIDDTAFPKKGRHSVGVARQYCGQLGKQENCQVAVSLSAANHHASLPVAWRLYLPQSWAGDPALRRQAGVPDAVRFQTKPEIACDQLRAACAAGLPRGVVLLDAGYGDDTWLRSEITSLGLAIRCRRAPPHLGLAAGNRPVAAEEMARQRAAADPAAARPAESAGLGERPGAGPAGERLEHDRLARRLRQRAVFALRPGSRAAGASRPAAVGASAGGMAFDRMAGRRERAKQVLAGDCCRGHQFCGIG